MTTTDEIEDRVANKLAVPVASPMGEFWRTAQLLARSHYFHDSNTSLTPEKAFSKILAGNELGFGPIASLRGVYIVQNQITYSAQIIAAAIQRSGMYRYQVRKLDREGCILMFFERMGQEWVELGPSSFDAEDQKVAKLSGVNWQAYPRNMFFARALSNGARWYCPSVFAGPVYTPDEMGAQVDDDGVVIEIPAAPPMDTAEQKRLANKYVQIHGDDGTTERKQALLIANAKVLQTGKDVGVPAGVLRQFNAQSSWSDEQIEAANAEVQERINSRNAALDEQAAVQAGQMELTR